MSLFDGRLWPFLLTGFGLFLSLGVIQITIGFLFQDRLDLSAQGTARTVGLALFATGLSLLFAQGFLVPRLGWPPLRLIRAGIPVALLGMLALVFASGFASMTAALMLIGAGIGLASPGYTAAPTLMVARNEQGGVAGLISATNALTFVFGPAIGTALYGLGPGYPYAFGALLLGLLFAFVLLHPGIRRAARRPETVEPGQP